MKEFANAIAGRLNGILKTEFNLYGSQVSFEELEKMVVQSIVAYNHFRPHPGCDYLTPNQAYQKSGLLKKRWKNYFQNSFTNPANYKNKKATFEKCTHE